MDEEFGLDLAVTNNDAVVGYDIDGTEVYFDWNALSGVVSSCNTLAEKINNISTLIDNVKSKLDIRIVEGGSDLGLASYFESLTDEYNKLNAMAESIKGDLVPWLNAQIADAQDADKYAQKISEETPEDWGYDPIGTSPDPDIETPTTPEATPTSGGVDGGGAPIIAPVAPIAEEEIDETVEGEHLEIGPVVDPLEQYNVSKGDWENLSDEDKTAIVDKLKEVGYSDEEIEALQNGEYNLPKVAMSDVAEALENALKTDESLRDKLIDKYGFDLFYEDGTINPTKLASALMIDAGNSSDAYDLINMLINDYGIDLIGMGDLNNLVTQLMNGLELNPDLREQLLNKYGFDIFNEDGTVNIDKLRYAIMIDGFDNVDNLDMINTLYDCYGIDVLSLGSLDDLSLKLLELARSDPSMRQKFIDKYGFDIFNEDGTVNQEKLRYALMLDAMDGDNKFDFINIMNGNDTAGVISNEDFDGLSLKLLSGLEFDPELRQQLIDRYGFDIFNADGTINNDRLRYALMMDRFNEEDDFDLMKFIDEFIAGQTDNTKTKKGSAIPIIAGIGLAAASAGAGYTIYKKRKEEEEEDSEDDFVPYDEEDDTEI